jgi:antitoxin PrlF
MELAKLTSKGQITIPKEIRDKLKFKTGDKVVFIFEGDKIIFANSSLIALKKLKIQCMGKQSVPGLKTKKILTM